MKVTVNFIGAKTPQEYAFCMYLPVLRKEQTVIP